jgi:hypothetical protein
MSIPRRRLRPNCEDGPNRRPDKEDSDAQDHDISDVRPPGEDAANFYTSVFKNSKIVSATRYGDAGPVRRAA